MSFGIEIFISHQTVSYLKKIKKKFSWDDEKVIALIDTQCVPLVVAN